MNELKSLVKLNIPHKIVYTKYKRLVLKFDRTGRLVIRCPKLVLFSEVERFVNNHLDWIIKHYDESKLLKKTYNTGDDYLYLGINYKLNVIESRHTGVFLQNDELIVYVKSKDKVKDELNKWRLQQATIIFEEMLYQAFKKMENDLEFYPKLQIKKYVARWGCCYPKRKLIYLNIALIHVPLHLINYVIFHELTHFIYMDHSDRFHKHLQKYVKDERLYKKELSKYSASYE